MNVGRPAAIFVDVTDAGESLAARDALPHLECVKGFSGEVAVEREKFEAVPGCVTKNYDRPVIERRGIDRDCVDEAVERRVDWRARSAEQIYAEMNGTPLIRGIRAGPKKRRSVEQARFVVPPDSNGGIGALHLAEDRLVEVVSLCGTRISAKESAADAQIKDKSRSCAQVRFENGGCAAEFGRNISLY